VDQYIEYEVGTPISGEQPENIDTPEFIVDDEGKQYVRCI
jgi:hypothetical protein